MGRYQNIALYNWKKTGINYFRETERVVAPKADLRRYHNLPSMADKPTAISNIPKKWMSSSDSFRNNVAATIASWAIKNYIARIR